MMLDVELWPCSVEHLMKAVVNVSLCGANQKADERVTSWDICLFLCRMQLYFRAIKLNQKPSKMSHVESFPSFWHKNFALVCERLLHVEPPSGLDKVLGNNCQSSSRLPIISTVNSRWLAVEMMIDNFRQLSIESLEWLNHWHSVWLAAKMMIDSLGTIAPFERWLTVEHWISWMIESLAFSMIGS